MGIARLKRLVAEDLSRSFTLMNYKNRIRIRPKNETA